MLRDGYDPVHDAISRLAELGAPNRWVVTTGMVVFGVGSLAFAPLLVRNARLALSVAGGASFAVAAFPCTAGCPGTGSFTDIAHVGAAATFYVSFVLVPLFERNTWIAPVVAGIAGLALSVHGVGVGPNGLLQRAGLTLLDAWLIVTALSFLESDVRRGGA